MNGLRKTFQNNRTKPPPDYVRIAYLEYCVGWQQDYIESIFARLTALEASRTPATLNLNRVVSEVEPLPLIAEDIFPPRHFDPDFICKCGNFSGVEDDAIRCKNCGGLLF